MILVASKRATHRMLTIRRCRIQQDFTAKLVQCGWRDELKDVAKYSVRDCGGITEVTLDELVAQVVPHGEATVPQTIKEEMMEQIRQAVRQEQRP
jgi:enhancer of yellow 2 transcription factor